MNNEIKINEIISDTALDQISGGSKYSRYVYRERNPYVEKCSAEPVAVKEVDVSNALNCACSPK